MSADEIRRRATSGALLLVLRGVAVRAISLLGFVILAALLAPRAIGQLSFGLTIVSIGGLLVDGGMGAALIKRSADAEREDLEAVSAMQMALALAVAIPTFLALWRAGTTGLVTAIMVWTLPLLGPRTVALVVTERELRYAPAALADLVDAITFVVVAVTALAVGAGVVGVAVAMVARSAFGTATLLAMVPDARVAPRWRWARMKGLISFGARFQAVGVLGLVRDQGLNVGIAGVAGLTTLGYWTFASRIMQVPLLIFAELRRVSFPTMARLHDNGEEIRPAVERLAERTAVATGGLIVVLAGGAYFGITEVFGQHWSSAAEVIPWGAAALLVSGPVSVAASGYLYATGRATDVLWAVAAYAFAWLAVTLALVGQIGVPAAGIGWLVGAWTEAALFSRFLRRASGASVLQAIGPPTACGALGVAAGLAAGWAAPAAGVRLFLAGIVGGAVYLAAVGLICPRTARSTWRTLAVPLRRLIAPRRNWAGDAP